MRFRKFRAVPRSDRLSSVPLVLVMSKVGEPQKGGFPGQLHSVNNIPVWLLDGTLLLPFEPITAFSVIMEFFMKRKFYNLLPSSTK